MEDAYWDVECYHMRFFNRNRYSGYDGFKTLLRKAKERLLKMLVFSGFQCCSY